MAKKFMKKVVALFLSVVMVVSSVPFVATAAVAADDPLLVSAQNAMKLYTDKMDGTVYTNMAAAYEAYVKLNGMVDRYKYIGSSTGVSDQITALNNATNNMTAWQSYQGTKYATFSSDADNVTEEDYLKTNVNVLYAPTASQQGTSGQLTTASGTFGTCWGEGRLHYSPNAVLLYDGKKTPMIVAASEFYAGQSGTWSTNNAELACYLSGATNGMSINATWYGPDSRLNCQWMVVSEVMNNTLAGTDTVQAKWGHIDTKKTSHFYATNYKFTGTFGKDETYRSFNPTFTFHFACGDSDTSLSGNQKPEVVGANPIHIINYKMLLDAIDGCASVFQSISTYSHGGAMAMMQAIQTAQNYDPTAQDFSDTANAVVTVGSKISELTAAITASKTTDNLKADNTKYEQLAEAIAQSESTMLRGNADGAYEAQSWQDFADAYNNAVTIVANIPVSPYYSQADEAVAAASTLTTAKANLKTVGKVDTTDLEISLNNLAAAVANSSMFTSASYSAANLETLGNDVKVAIWGSLDNYGVDAEKISDTEDNRTLVADYTSQVNTAIAKLRIDVTAVVASAGESMEAAINDSAQYTANADEYANIAVLQDAVAAANNFIANENVAVDGSIAGTVTAQISKYQTLVKNITDAIRFLRPSFAKTTDGTMVTPGTEVTTKIESTHGDSSGFWKLTWTRRSGTIIFRTTHDDVTYELPDSTWWYSNDKCQVDSMLDAVTIFASQDVDNIPEITSSKTQSSCLLTTAQRETYQGPLSVNGGGIDYAVTSVKLTNIGGPSSDYGRDVAGNSITDLSYDWIDTLRTCEGGNDGNENWLFAGGPVVKQGTNTYNVKTTAHMDATPAELTATTKPTLSTFSAALANARFAMTYYWAYRPTGVTRYYGFGYNYKNYEQEVHIIDISTLLDLVAECDALTKNEEEKLKYSTASWNAFTTALGNAKAEFVDLENLDANTIKNGCVDRYTNLWTARKNLKLCASNANLKAAVNACTDVYNNDAALCETESFAAFRTAYQAAASKYAGDYSDSNIRNYDKGGSEEQEANSLATALNEAYAALKYYADFTALDAAAANLATGIADRQYSAKTLQALADVLAGKHYLSMDEVTRKTVYRTGDDATNEQDDIDLEKDEIVALADTLTDSVCNTDVLEAAKAEIKAKADDPDAYAGIDAAIQNLGDNWYTPVTIIGSISKEGSVFDTTEEVDAEVRRILEYDITPQMYQVKVDGEPYIDEDDPHTNGMYQYGETVIVKSNAGRPVNWKYSHVSNTATCAQKYFATAEDVEFVVKGNTELVTSIAKDANTNQIKVTFKNRLNGMTYDYKYVTKGSDYTLPSTVPTCANFKFDGYTDASGASVTSVPTTEDITVYANYVYDAAGKYTVNIAGLISLASEHANYIKISNLNYNDEISLLQEDMGNKTKGTDAVIHIDTTSDDVTVEYHVANNANIAGKEVDGVINGAKGDVVIPGACRVISSYDTTVVGNANTGIGGYVEFASNADFNSFITSTNSTIPYLKLEPLIKAGTIEKVKVASIGKDYIFRVHENMDIMPMSSKQQLFGFYSGDADTSTVTATSLYAKGLLDDFELALDDAGKSTIGAARAAMHPVLNLKSDIVVATGKFSMIADYTLPEGFEAVESGILFCSNGTATAPDVNLTLSNVGTNGIMRLKSTRHTQANQYVISINNGTKTGDLGVAYAAYLVYKDANGNMQSMVTAKNTNVITLK
ncbi:MAG: hypothetical protein ACI4IN_07940 [Eubacterium sp.]